MSASQLALDGFTTARERTRPTTLIHCRDCDEWILRSRREEHEEHTVIDPEVDNRVDTTDDEDEEDDDDENLKVGAWYDITLSYSVDYRFRVAAWSEHEAEEVAKELQLDARPADSMHVHTDKRELEELYEDDADVPDDFDPYGGDRLHFAIKEAESDE